MGYLPYGKSSGQPAYNGEARTERGCVEDQPQRVGSSKGSRACRVLRLVEDDTAALRLQHRAERGCVEDQPQQVGSSKRSGVCRVLRLVEDDTAALRPVVENLLSVIGDTTVGLAGIGAPITNNQF